MKDFPNIETYDDTQQTRENCIKVAILLFAGYVDGATSIAESCGGGGWDVTKTKTKMQGFVVPLRQPVDSASRWAEHINLNFLRHVKRCC